MRTLAIASGKGGVGKTSVACNLAAALADRDLRVLLFDADLQLANADIAMGIEPVRNLSHVLSGECTLGETLCEGPNGVMVACGGSGISPLMHAGPKRIDKLLREVEDVRQDYDYAIFDLGAGLDNRVFRIMRYVAETVIVTTPEPTAITDAYALAKVHYRRIPKSVLRLIVNQTTGADEGRTVHGTIATVLRHYLKCEIGYLGSVRRDEAAYQSVRRRAPFFLTDPIAPASLDINQIANQVVAGHSGIANALGRVRA